jgi:hypothetical protein
MLKPALLMKIQIIKMKILIKAFHMFLHLLFLYLIKPKSVYPIKILSELIFKMLFYKIQL